MIMSSLSIYQLFYNRCLYILLKRKKITSYLQIWKDKTTKFQQITLSILKIPYKYLSLLSSFQ
jgi:hypothetical protein